jgi:hypothetical protein
MTLLTERLLQPVIQLYREERWYELLEDALLLALDCVKQLDDEASVFRYSLELLSDGTYSVTRVDGFRIPTLGQ